MRWRRSAREWPALRHASGRMRGPREEEMLSLREISPAMPSREPRWEEVSCARRGVESARREAAERGRAEERFIKAAG